MALHPWLAFKPKSPYGVLPMLEVDGKLYGGTLPIVRYVAEQYGLAGNALENFELAGIYDTTQDLESKLIPIYEEKDEEKKAQYNSKKSTFQSILRSSLLTTAQTGGSSAKM